MLCLHINYFMYALQQFYQDIFDINLEIMKKDQQKSKHNQNQRASKSIFSLIPEPSGLDQLLFFLLSHRTYDTNRKSYGICKKHIKTMIDGLQR